MPRSKRTVADREISLKPTAPEANFTIAGARSMYSGMAGSSEIHCTISGHCRTRVFEFPGISFHPDGEEPHHNIYKSTSVNACLVSNLPHYFENAAVSKHYTLSPCLRHAVTETDTKVRSQQKNNVPVFVVVEESNELTPIAMTKGECNISDEVAVRNGQMEPVLVGGRKDKKFITAWATVDGAWPALPDNEHTMSIILAGVRVAQRTPEPIRKYVDQSCLVTDDCRFVEMMRPTMSARMQTATTMNSKAYGGRAFEIKNAIAALELDIRTPHMALLVKSMYRDEYKDDPYERLQYRSFAEKAC